MTAFNRTPTNTNFLQTSKFTLQMSRIPEIVYMCQTVSIPGISMGEVIVPTPFIDYPIPGDKLQFDAFDITFMIDEKMESWFSIFDWMKGMTFPEEFNQFKNQGTINRVAYNRMQDKMKPYYTDATLTVLTSHNNPRIRFHFQDMFPIVLSPIPLSTSDTTEITPVATVSFRFKTMTYERI